MDERDDRLMALLRGNVRTTVAELARRVNLSPNAVRHRLARLERDGRIAGYTLREPDETSDAGPFEALVLVTHTAGCDCERLQSEIEGMAAVRRLVSVAGKVDSAVWLAAASLDDLHHTARAIAALDCVERCASHMALDVLIDR